MSLVDLVISDLDGTLLTPEHEVSAASLSAIQELEAHGIGFSVTSARPPLGLRYVASRIPLRVPVAAFNGGMIFEGGADHRSWKILEEFPLPAETSAQVLRWLDQRGVSWWMYRGLDWLVPALDIPHLEWERSAVQFNPLLSDPRQIPTDGILKIVAISDDPELLTRVEQEIRNEFGDLLQASRSQTFYLDITHPMATKGNVVLKISELLGIPTARIATIGDMPSDALMFEKSGISIAMGNASEEVQAKARFVTLRNTEEGFAHAMRELVLERRS